MTAAFAATLDWLKSNWDLVLVIILGPIGVVIALIKRNWDTVTRIFDAFLRFRDRRVPVDRVGRDVGLERDPIAPRRPSGTRSGIVDTVTNAIKRDQRRRRRRSRSRPRSDPRSVRVQFISGIARPCSAQSGRRSTRSDRPRRSVASFLRSTLANVFDAVESAGRPRSMRSWDRSAPSISDRRRDRHVQSLLMAGTIKVLTSADSSTRSRRGRRSRRAGRPGRRADVGPRLWAPSRCTWRESRSTSGALDPDAVARQIDRILAGRSRRVGGVRTNGRRAVTAPDCVVCGRRERFADTAADLIARRPIVLADLSIVLGTWEHVRSAAAGDMYVSPCWIVTPADVFTDRLHVGDPLEVHAAGDIAQGTPVDVAVDGGFEASPVGPAGNRADDRRAGRRDDRHRADRDRDPRDPGHDADRRTVTCCGSRRPRSRLGTLPAGTRSRVWVRTNGPGRSPSGPRCTAETGVVGIAFNDPQTVAPTGDRRRRNPDPPGGTGAWIDPVRRRPARRRRPPTIG